MTSLPPQQREQLDLFRALPGDMAPRDAQDLMAFPFFSLAKTPRTKPIHFQAGGVTVRVEGTVEHGLATIWDADILIWAASQIVEARDGRPQGIELILPDWFYAGVMEEALVLTIDPAYFKLTGGIERWLYRLVRKHGGRQRGGWQFDFPHLYRKSGSMARPYDFAYDLRALVARQSLPGYVLSIERSPGGPEILAFRPRPPDDPRRGPEAGVPS